MGWVNTDGAFDLVTRDAGVGVVVRNCNGEMINGFGCLVNVSSAVMSEFRACEQGVQLALWNKYEKVVFETDSLEVFKFVYFKNQNVSWCVKVVAANIVDRLKLVPKYRLPSILRGANMAADWVATQFKRKICPENWLSQPPSSFVNVLSRDGLPAPP
ncbi:hypothetical protein PVK06_049830 [Gossypium arboreum]|uniref:RNase H type-1 domain-containing protein n=1 Tax=Gossypium arboreum TaxID=29729 RepID=A0ABR0MMD4_GOSAR|nr:hypothetical protein PVK06_049830 [Gossypium arboreum]